MSLENNNRKSRGAILKETARSIHLASALELQEMQGKQQPPMMEVLREEERQRPGRAGWPSPGLGWVSAWAGEGGGSTRWISGKPTRTPDPLSRQRGLSRLGFWVWTPAGAVARSPSPPLLLRGSSLLPRRVGQPRRSQILPSTPPRQRPRQDPALPGSDVRLQRCWPVSVICPTERAAAGLQAAPFFPTGPTASPLPPRRAASRFREG